MLHFFFQDIVVGRDVLKIYDSIKHDYPQLELVFSTVSHDPLTTPTQTTKQDYRKLNLRQAKALLYESLKSSGLDPNYLLPKNESIEWDVDDLKSALQVKYHTNDLMIEVQEYMSLLFC